MRRAAKVDDNHTEIIEALRMLGCSVVSLAAVGNGVPDILVGRAETGRNYLLEIKDGSKSPSRRKLTKDQVEFLGMWKGHAVVVCDVYEAMEAVGI